MILYIALCDDEMIDLIQEKELIGGILPSVISNIKLEPAAPNIQWEIDIFTSSKDMLKSPKTYNIIFLDVEMDGMNGIQTAEALHKKSPISLIFFVTHHEDYMDEALDNHAFRFWTKPINETRLIYGIQSAIKKIITNKRNITVTAKKKSVTILLKDIIYVHHSNRLTYIITTNGTVETRDSLQSIAEQLTDECFFETHASCYVNLNYVTYYNKVDITCEYDGKIYKPFISTRKYSAFNRRFREWSGELQ